MNGVKEFFKANWLVLVIASSILIVIILFFFGARAWNGVGNYFFQREVTKARAEVQQQLDQAAQQKKELERTLIELDLSKRDLEKATKAREEAEAIFNDKSKTSAQKVADYKAVLADAPIRTNPSGVTTDDLCQRAKANGADATVVNALCGQ